MTLKQICSTAVSKLSTITRYLLLKHNTYFVIPCIILLSLTAVSDAKTLLRPVARSVEIGKVFDDGTFRVKEDTVPYIYRLWGVQPDVDHFRTLVKGQTLECYDAGKSLSPRRTIIIILNCNMNSETTPISISQHLVQSGNGRELCIESRNWFKTCE